MRRLVCATHGHCFDGLASATLLAEIVLSEEPQTRCCFLAWGYTGRQAEGMLDGDDNAILDYRYRADDRLTYYFDHHPTAFLGEAERTHFAHRQKQARDRFVFDDSSVSCAELVHQAAVARGLNLRHLDSLVQWAHIVDGAQYPNVHAATNLDDRMISLVQVVTHFGDAHHLTRWVEVLRRDGLEGLLEDRLVRTRFRTLRPALRRYNRRVRDAGKLVGRVAYVDLAAEHSYFANKFQQYLEFPQCAYSVLLTRSKDGHRISVGHNPWNGRPCDVNVGRICQSFGGGGHYVVGGVALPDSSSDEARRIASSIAERLQSPES